MHAVNETAAMLGISPPTLRRWADAAAPILPDFRPGLAPRRFSDGDVVALAGLLELAKQHPELSRSQIVSQVHAGALTLPTITTLQPAPETARPPARRTEETAALETLTAQIETLTAAVARLTAQIETLTTQPLQIEAPKPPTPPSVWQRIRAWFTGPQE